MSKYPHLLSPGKIGNLEIRNRLVQSAMGTNLSEVGGFVGDALLAYHEARARGGVGMIITEAIAVGLPYGKALRHQLGVSDEKFVPGLTKLAQTVQKHGAKICLQLHFAGIMAGAEMAEGRPVWVPSIPLPPTGPGFAGALFPEEQAKTSAADMKAPPTFKVLEQADIDQLIEFYASGAERAKRCGFDAVEIHGGHGYIIAGFCSRATNRRTDGYGGSIENRGRLLREVVTAVRERVGPDYPMWIKLDSEEFFTQDGITPDEACEFARMAEACGAQAITVSANPDYGQARVMFSSYLPHQPGKLIPNAAKIRAAVNVPVITVGRIDPEVADKAIAEGKFDFMAMGRKQLADSDFANNLALGGKERVRPCIYCYTCLSQAMVTEGLRCSVNADLGYETANLLAPTKQPKTVVVVGGGPGGMEAARRLTLRGHRAILLESGDQLGGTARIAAIAYAPNGDFVEWLKARLEELQVEVRLNTRATLDSIRALNPDAVVVATGAIRRAPPIEGKDQDHVHDGMSLRAMLTGEGDTGKATLVQKVALGAARRLGITDSPEAVRQATKLWMPVGDEVVIIGGELVGIELAEFMHERGRKVTVIGEAPQMGRGLSPARRAVVLDELHHEGLALHAGVSDISIGAKTVRFTTPDGTAHEVRSDTVIIAKGAEANTGLYDELKAAGVDAHMVGDCQGVGYIIGAVRNAADVAAVI
jgi:2,4-dienoyl-CoA reductase-like NADH-dependent reductase (Old Yellow Enzyme family)/thioredoxin reductase